MPGKIKRLLDDYIHLRTRGNAARTSFVRAHLIMSGLDPDRVNESTADDPVIEQRIQTLITDFQASNPRRVS